MAQLTTLLQQRDAVANDLADFMERAIQQQSGLTGVALKGAVSAAKKAKPSIVRSGAYALLPEVLEALQPQWEGFEAAGAQDFGQYLQDHDEAALASLLRVADNNAKNINVPGLDKAYQGLRGKAGKIVTPHLPELGSILQRHMQAAS